MTSVSSWFRFAARRGSLREKRNAAIGIAEIDGAFKCRRLRLFPSDNPLVIFPSPPSDVPIRLNTKYSGKHVFLINLDGYDVEKIRRQCENSHRIPLKIHSESVVARNDRVDLYYDLFSANVL